MNTPVTANPLAPLGRLLSLARLPALVAAVAIVASVLAAPASAQVLRKELPQLDGVGIVEHRGDLVPSDIHFKDARGRDVAFGSYFDGQRPVILVMAYFECPLLCTLILNDVQRCLNKINWTAGDEFRIVTVSFNHKDTPATALAKQESYLAGYAKDVSPDAWPFLTGDVENIRRLAGAVGFHYRYLPESGEFSHPAALIIIAPDGRIHNYIENMVFDPAQVKQALMEAADGRVGSVFDRVAHFCFAYDFTTGKYTARVFRIMQIGAGGTFLGLALFVGYVGMSRSRRARVAHALDAAASEQSELPGPPQVGA